MSPGMPTLVVNLESRPDRLARFTAIGSLLADIERLPAVNGRAVDRAPDVPRWRTSATTARRLNS